MKQKIHIIGGGIAGLSCAYKLVELGMHETHEIHIYEASDKLGGHLTHCAKDAGICWVMFNGPYKQYADLFNVENVKNVSPLFDKNDESDTWNIASISSLMDISWNNFLSPKNLNIVDIGKLSLLGLLNTNNTKTSLFQFLSENENYLSQNAKDFVQYVAILFLFYGDQTPIYPTFNTVPKVVLETSKYYSFFGFNHHQVIEKMQEYLFKNEIHIHLNTYISSKHSKRFFANGKKMQGSIVIATDPLTANKKFGMKIPLSLQGPTSDFRHFFVIKSPSKNITSDFRKVDMNLFRGINRLKYKLGITIIRNPIDNSYTFLILPQSFYGKINNNKGKSWLDCNQVEFEDELLRRIGCFQYTKKTRKDIRFEYPPHIKFVDGKITNIDKRQNMFTPVVGTYETLTPIQTDDPNVYCCGVYCQQTSDPLFTVDASINTAYKVAQLIFDKEQAKAKSQY